MAKRKDGFFEDDARQTEHRPSCPRLTADVLAEYVYTLKKRPAMMPAEAIAASEWWMRHQSPPKPYEAARQVETRDGPIWQMPYTERTLYCLKKFCSLSHADQTIVVAAAEDGCFWRGDDMGFFFHNNPSVYTETMRMREIGVDAYKAESKIYARSMIKKITAN